MTKGRRPLCARGASRTSRTAAAKWRRYRLSHKRSHPANYRHRSGKNRPCGVDRSSEYLAKTALRLCVRRYSQRRNQGEGKTRYYQCRLNFHVFLLIFCTYLFIAITAWKRALPYQYRKLASPIGNIVARVSGVKEGGVRCREL